MDGNPRGSRNFPQGGTVKAMPIYEYESVMGGCPKCSPSLEVIQRLADPPLNACPECGGKLRRKISRPQIILPGSAKGKDAVEGKVAEYEQQGRYSHAAELADIESEKPERAYLKERAIEDYRKAGYDF